jgi:5'-3' exonuclease
MVITEDSDLLAFGVRKVIFKMDKNGNASEINLDNIGQCELFEMG